MTEIQTFVGAHYIFSRHQDILYYIAKLLSKDKFFYDNIKNMSKQKCCCTKIC